MKYKVDTYEDFLKLKPVEVNSIFENFELYSDEEMSNVMNFVAMFESSLPEKKCECSIVNEDASTDMFSTYTNKELLNGFEQVK